MKCVLCQGGGRKPDHEFEAGLRVLRMQTKVTWCAVLQWPPHHFYCTCLKEDGVHKSGVSSLES